MLSPLLEQLVLTNQATVKTHNHGVGGVGTINVPAGKKIIITQIIWNPFVDQSHLNNGIDILNNSGSFLHTLKLRNKQCKFAFNFRDTVQTGVFTKKSGSGVEGGVMPSVPQIINTYLPFTEGNIEIDIMKFNDFNNWVNFPSYVPEFTVEPNPGEGYGNLNSVIKYMAMGNVMFYGAVPPPFKPYAYAPMGTRGAIANDAVSNEFEASEPIRLPGNNPNNTDVAMFPIVTFTYVEINNRYVPGTVGSVKFNK